VNNHTYIKDFANGQQISQDYYVCTKKIERQTKDGKPYIQFTVSDKSGQIDGKMWDNAIKEFGADFSEKSVVVIRGRIDLYEGRLQMVADRIAKADSKNYDATWFLPQSPVGIADILTEMTVLLSSIKDHGLKRVVGAFFDDPEIADNFKTAPGATNLHHAYIGGLAHHTLCVMKFCDHLTQLYPTIDRDVLLVAALFHDIGKTKENSWDLSFERTNEGELIGHIIISRDIFRDCAKRSELEPRLTTHIEHCILSHHGSHEYGSPKLPMTVESFALHLADLGDSRMDEYFRMLEKVPEGGSTDRIKFLDNRKLFRL
jgi:3'-5' exoribonuclease